MISDIIGMFSESYAKQSVASILKPRAEIENGILQCIMIPCYIVITPLKWLVNFDNNVSLKF